MSTSLTAYAKGGNLPSLDRDAMAQALLQTSAEESTGSASDGVEYISFSGKTGTITYGRDRHDLDQTEVFLMEPRSAFQGWICWVDSRPVARHQWSIYQKHLAVAEEDLEDKGPYDREQDGWKSMLGFGFISTESAEVVQYSFSTNSPSGKNAVKDLFKEIAKRTTNGEPNFPLFRFTREKFKAKGEWNWKPKFDIDEWLTETEAAELMGAEVEAPAPEPEPEPEPEAKPQRRTRTRRT
jgi:hypothetical protein